MKRQSVIRTAVVLLGLLTGLALADGPDQFSVIVPGAHVTASGGTAIGGFYYQASTGRFFTSTYGQGRNLRVFSATEQFPDWSSAGIDPYTGKPYFYPENPYETAAGRSWTAGTDSDLGRVMGATDFEGGKLGAWSITGHLLNGFAANPVTIVYKGRTYGPGEFVVLSNNNGGVANSKRLVTWDLRQIWSPTDKQPDRDNAEWITGILEKDYWGPVFGFGCVNWNDAFDSLATHGQIAAAIGANTRGSVSDQIGGRRFMFSADGTQVYYVAMDSASATRMNGNGFTGVWATALDGTTRRLWDDTGRDIVIPQDDIPLADLIKAKLAVIPTSEPGAVAIGTRNFTGQSDYASTVSQVLFNGTGVSGNIGGINALVDDRNPNNLTDPNWTPSIYVALENQRLFDILGLGHIDLDDVANASIIGSLPKVWGIVSDAEGVIYFATTSPQTLFQYDTKGRLIALGTRAQHLAFNLITMPSQSAPTNTAYNRTQLRTIPAPYDADETLTQVLFMSTPEKGVFGVTVYKPIDFDRDGSVTLADLNFFKTQIQKTRTETAPSVLLAGTSTDPNIIVDTQEVIDYLKADISGNIETVGSNRTTGWTFNAGVDEKDIEVLHQFVVPGDVNLDYSINLADLISFAENFYGTDKDWSHGDFDFDGDVDLDDFALLSAHWMETYEE